jgi:hypothetical protein
MPRLEIPDVAAQPDGHAGVCEGQQHPRTRDPRRLRNRLGQARRLAQRPDAKDSRRAAVQHDPVIDALGSEKALPTLLAHASSLS